MNNNIIISENNDSSTSNSINIILQEIYDNLKDLTIINGTITSNNDQPYSITSPFHRSDHILFSDTSKKIQDIRSSAFIVISKDALKYDIFHKPEIIRPNDLITENYGQLVFTKNDFISLINKYKKLIGLFIPLIFFPLTAIFLFLKSAALIIIMSIIVSINQPKEKKESLRRSLTISQGPILTILMVDDFLPISIQLLVILIIITYTTVSIRSTKN